MCPISFAAGAVAMFLVFVVLGIYAACNMGA